MRPLVFNRRTFAAVTAWTAVSLSAPALWAQARLEKSKITIAVAGRSDYAFLPLTIAEQRGYFRAEGLDVEVIDFAARPKALQAVALGAAYVGAGSYEQTLTPLARSHTLQSFVLQGRSPGVAMGVSTRALPHFKSVADLRGKRIGVMAYGSAAHVVAQRVLSRAGLKPADASYVSVDSADEALAAFQAGQIEALSHVDPALTFLEQKGAIHIVADTRTLKGAQTLFGGGLPGACLYAPAAFLQQCPNTAQAITYAMVRALKWLQTAGPSDMMKTVPETYMLGDRALYLAAFNKLREVISVDGVMREDGPPTALSAFARLDPSLKSDHLDLSTTYTNRFANIAKTRFRA